MIKKGKIKNKNNDSKNNSNGLKTSLPIDEGSKKDNKRKVGGLNPKPALS